MFSPRTPRLTLRDFKEEDWRIIHEMAQEPAIARYQSVLRLNSMEEVHQWVQNGIFHNNQQPREAYNLLIVEREQKRDLGWIG